jgi:predicted amidophosphoribosyltransferase
VSEPLCIICHEDEATNSLGMCRDCEIEHLLNEAKCPECGRVLARDDLEEPWASFTAELGWGHAEDCSQRARP